MAINLSAYKSIQTNMFVRLDIPGYQVLTFSDYHKTYTLGATTYQGLGQMLGISNTSNSLRATSEELTLTISGIPSGNVSDIIAHKIKGSKILILNALRKETHISHYNLEQALQLIEEVKPEKTYLTHISHHMGLHAMVEKELPTNVHLAYDELELEF